MMISSPPSFLNIKNGLIASFNFIRKKGRVDELFEINTEKFWHSCWIIFLVNALVAVLASYGIKTSFDVSMKITLLPKLFLITIIDITLYSILVFYIFKNLNKTESFLRFIIPFNWLQAFQSFVMLFLTFFGLFFPPSVFLFFGFVCIILVTFSLWRIGKEDINLTGWGATGLIILSVCTEAGISLASRFLTKFFT